MTSLKVRLKESEIKAIKQTIKEFDNNAKIYIYGSRADLTKRGGDIDILVISDKIDLKKQLKIKAKLYTKLGDRKIDLIVVKDPKEKPFTELIFEEAVEI